MFEQRGGAADHPEPVLSVAQRLAVGLAGPGVGSVTAVAGLDPEQLSEDERLDLLIVLERNGSWLEAKQHRLLAVIDRDDQSTHGWAREQVMLALTETAGVAQRRLRTARTLAGEGVSTLLCKWVRA
jgi:hypothetical protein